MLDPMKNDPTARSGGSAQSLAERAEAIFHGALQLPAEQRAGYLKQACGDNAELLKQVEILLTADEKAGGFHRFVAGSLLICLHGHRRRTLVRSVRFRAESNFCKELVARGDKIEDG